jgi:hypothetical protein
LVVIGVMIADEPKVKKKIANFDEPWRSATACPNIVWPNPTPSIPAKIDAAGALGVRGTQQ